MKKDLIKKIDSKSGLVLFDRFDDIFAEFDGIFTRFGSLYDNFFSNTIGELKPMKASFPKINMTEDETGYDVEIAVAGFDKDDIGLEVRDNALFINAEKKEECCDDKEVKKYLCKEIAYRSFKRVLPFPAEISSDGISAKYENGVIKCRINKVLTAKLDSVKIEITE
jgi:HSP20 family protein